MPASFLHGVEVIEVPNGTVPVTIVKSAVIGLVGTAPESALAGQPDPARHFTALAATAFTFNTQGIINLGHMGVSNVVVTSSPAGTTYLAATDYTLDAINGVITIVESGAGGHIVDGATVLIAFNYADPSKVTDADVIGAVTSGVYSGLQV